MRPIELTFSGLRSYRSTATIDFTDLGLFAVIGDTGAGKSTIIEALSLALYGTYTWTGGRLDELIAEGANTMSIRLRFSVDGDEWIVTRSRHRNASAPVNKLECPTSGKKFDGRSQVNDQIVRLLGLTHDQFIRAVVMPQGRFDELLRATKTERNKILRSIFGLDDLKATREAAEALRADWAPVRDRTRAKREELPTDPAGERDAARALLTQAEHTAERLTRVAVAGDAHHETLTDLVSQLDRLEPALRAVPPDLGDPLGELTRLATRNDDIIERIRRAHSDKQDAEARVARLHREQDAALAGFADRDTAVKTTTRLDNVAAAVDTAAAELQVARTELEQLTISVPPAEVPADLAERSEAAQRSAEQARSAVGEARDRAREARTGWQRLVELVAQETKVQRHLPDLAEELLAHERSVERSTESVATAKDELTRAKVAHSDAVRSDTAAAVAQGCRPGDPCPVCARDLPEGFAPPVGTDLSTAADAVTAAESRLEQALEDLASSREALDRVRRDLDRATQAARDAAERVGVALNAARNAGVDIPAEAPQEGAPWAIDDPRVTASLDATVEAAERDSRAADDAALTARDALASAMAALRAQAERHQERLDAAKAAVASASAKLAEQRRATAALPTAWQPHGESTGDEIRSVARRLQDRIAHIDSLQSDRNEADLLRNDAARRLSELRAERAENVTQPWRSTLTRVGAYLERIRDVASALDAIPGSTPGEVTAELPPVGADLLSADPEDLTASVERVSRDLALAASIRAAADERATIIARRRLEEAEALENLLAEAGCETLAAVHHSAGEAHNSRLAAVDAVERSESAATRAEKLDAILAVADPFVADLDLLVTTLRDQHFVGHLVSLREAELLAEATRRLKAITGGRYGFVADFGVVNIGSGEVRTPDNLSGGERFQAALALALALVEIASRGAGRLDAVFVDEGFGTLDSSALDVALDTLGTVAGGGKMVALISHLRPVAEYVDTVLHVTKDDLSGSTISVLTGEDRELLLADDVRSGLTA